MTTLTYDRRGRLTAVKQPIDTSNTITIVYDTPVDASTNIVNGPTKITRSEQQDSVRAWLTSWTFVDGLGRTRETQTKSPNGGRIIAATEFDSRGMAVKSFDCYSDPAAPGTNMMTVGPIGSTIIPKETRIEYDSLGREYIRRAMTYGNEVMADGRAMYTTTSHGAFWTTVGRQWGEVVSQRYLDGRGAAVEADFVSLNANQSAWSYTVTYHDLNGMAVRADTAMGNRMTNTYDNFGRLLTATDPDAGAKSYTYRNDGALATETDARGTVLAYDSDVLGRVTAVRNGVAGPIVESYSFDRAGEAGLLDSASTFVDGAEYKIDTVGYDLRGRPTGYDYVIPSVAGLTAGTTLPGTYRFDSFGYDSRDQPTTLRYPAQGTFATETATTGFLSTGQPNNLISNFATYVYNSTYTNEGRLASRMLSLNTWGIKRSYTWDRSLGRLTGMKAEQNWVVLQNELFGYDAIGNLVRNSHDRPGTSDDHTECFSYDTASRLTRAFTNATVGAASNCASPAAGGPGAYDQSYVYDKDSNVTSGPAGATTYPVQGPAAVRPHAPLAAGASTLTYNADGTMATRTQGSASTTYTWTPQDRLASVTSGSTTSQMVYGPGGQRVIVKDASGVHLYLGNLAERHYNIATATTSERRYYTIGGTTVAVRKSPTSYDFVLGDIRGSVALAVTAGTNTTKTQWYTPWGAPRGTPTTSSVTSRAYIGQHRDSTGLSYLNHRYMDPATGTFLSVDPLNSTTGQPYLYAGGNPTTMSDPNGLEPCEYASAASGCRRPGEAPAMGPNRPSGPTDHPVGSDVEVYCPSTTPGICGNPPGPKGPPQTGGHYVPPEFVDDVESIVNPTDGLQADSGSGVGACVDASVSLVFSGEAQGCIVATDTDIGVLVFTGRGAGSPSVSATVSGVYTNADSVSQLSGNTLCATASGGALAKGTVSVCGSFDSGWSYTGVYSVSIGAGLGLQPGYSVNYTAGTTEVTTILSWSSITGVFNVDGPRVAPGLPSPTIVLDAAGAI